MRVWAFAPKGGETGLSRGYAPHFDPDVMRRVSGHGFLCELCKKKSQKSFSVSQEGCIFAPLFAEGG